ncbi:MAG: hypothetical protein ACF8MF_04670 [Phycisphaerales bacterium JB052]
MDNIKPWQIILIVVAVGVLGFSVWKQISKGSVNFPDSVLVVDVETGGMYRMDLGKRNGAYFPERSPETGRHTLMPVVKSEDDGLWYVSGHARSAMQDIDGTNKVVNESNWQVTIEDESVISNLKAGG